MAIVFVDDVMTSRDDLLYEALLLELRRRPHPRGGRGVHLQSGGGETVGQVAQPHHQVLRLRGPGERREGQGVPGQVLCG